MAREIVFGEDVVEGAEPVVEEPTALAEEVKPAEPAEDELPLNPLEDDAPETPADPKAESEAAAQAAAQELASAAAARDALALEKAGLEGELKALREVLGPYDGNMNALRFDHAFMQELQERIDDKPELGELVADVLKAVEKRGGNKVATNENPLREQRQPAATAKVETQPAAPAAETKVEKALARLNAKEATTILSSLDVRPDFHRQLADAVVKAAGADLDITEELVVKVVKEYKKANGIKTETLLLPVKDPAPRPPAGSSRRAPERPERGRGSEEPEAESDPVKRSQKGVSSRLARVRAYMSELEQATGRSR